MTRTNTLLIRTPEGVVFTQVLASPIPRFLAWLIDLAIVLSAAVLISYLLGALTFVLGGFVQALALLLYFLLSVGYGICFEWIWRGQTVGKRILRLRVIDAQGLRLRFSQVVIRNLLRVVDMLPICYLVGGIACLWNRRAQRLGDIAANTVVIRLPLFTQPDLDQLFAGKYNSFRSYPHLEARLRQQVNSSEATLALQALLRRDALDPQARIELFADIARYFQTKTRFPPEATDGLTDEQYVRNVADSLYRLGRTDAPSAPIASDPVPASL